MSLSVGKMGQTNILDHERPLTPAVDEKMGRAVFSVNSKLLTHIIGDGYVLRTPQGVFYPQVGTPPEDAVVRLEAVANADADFVQWEGSGVAYATSALTNPLPLDNPSQPLNLSAIWVVMGPELPGGTRSITARFRCSCGCGAYVEQDDGERCETLCGEACVEVDLCPDNPDKMAPGACGCEAPDTDSDGDWVPDCDDGCPDVPGKSEEGDCGCYVFDIDNDGDGVPNCNDQCPFDPLKTEKGVCDCYTLDSDSDEDGVVDCQDSCPNDPLKDDAGDCGCGYPEEPGCPGGGVDYRLNIDGAFEWEPFFEGSVVMLTANVEPTPPESPTFAWTTDGAFPSPSSGTGESFTTTLGTKGAVLVRLVASVGDVQLHASRYLAVHHLEIVPPPSNVGSIIELGSRLNFEGHFNRVTYMENVQWSWDRPIWAPMTWEPEYTTPEGNRIKFFQGTYTSELANVFTLTLVSGGKSLSREYSYLVGCANGIATIEKVVVASSTANWSKIVSALPRINQELQNDNDGDNFDDVKNCLAYSFVPATVDTSFPDPFYWPTDMTWYLTYHPLTDVAVVDDFFLWNRQAGITSLGKVIVSSGFEQVYGFGPLWLLTFHEMGHQAGHAHTDYYTVSDGGVNIMYVDIAADDDTSKARINASQLPWDE